MATVEGEKVFITPNEEGEDVAYTYNNISNGVVIPENPETQKVARAAREHHDAQKPFIDRSAAASRRIVEGVMSSRVITALVLHRIRRRSRLLE